MFPRQKWTAHRFNLDIHPGWSHNILTRVTDTVVRLRHHCDHMSEAELTLKPDGGWSIKEHIGHLIDLEELHHKRLVEFSELRQELSGADMLNIKTEKADHNSSSMQNLLNEFNESRVEFLETFRLLPKNSLEHLAMHPRLKVPMKPVDLLFFVAEHDDHHLTSILEIKQMFST